MKGGLRAPFLHVRPEAAADAAPAAAWSGKGKAAGGLGARARQV